MNKKVLLGLTVLATPFVVENLVETNVASANQTVVTETPAVKNQPVATATTAGVQKQPVATATTAVQTPPVAAAAQVAESKQPATRSTPVVAKSSEYVLNKPAKAYVTANDAAKRVNQKATYQAGTYYVYNQNQGMVNISKATGKAGSWINPVDNPNAKVATTPASATKTTSQAAQVSTTVQKPESSTTNTATATNKSTNLTVVPPKSGQYTILKPTDTYVNAIDASKKDNARGRISAGNYYIFREYKGMLNVSRFQGKVGSWINPTTTIIDSNPTTPVTKPETPVVTKPNVTQPTVVTKTLAGLFTITSPTEAYVNAVDASKKVNARGRVAAGDYHIFREYKGMLNVSKAKGKAGSWINPGVVTTTTSAPVTTTPVQTETKPTSSATKPETPVVTKPTVTQPTVGTKTPAGLFTIASPTEAYVNAVDASKKVNARGRVAAGDYHIYREYKGMLNVSKAKGKAGSWINPGVVPATTTPALVTTKPETKPTTNTQAAGNKTNTGLFTITSPTEAYVNSADASKKVNAKGTLAAGDYHIYREYKGMLNVSKAKGKIGSWINPNGTVVTTKLPETASVTKEVSGAGVKYYTQDKASWSNKRYGIGTMHHTGCVPTSLAMAISTLSNTVTPEQVANYLWNNTTAFNKTVQGTISTGITKALNHYGLKYKVVNTKSGLDSELGKGNMVLSLVQGSQFITPGYTHAVIAKGLDKLGQTTVYNPYSTYGIKKFSTNTLFKGQSQDPDDRRLGGTFISIFK